VDELSLKESVARDGELPAPPLHAKEQADEIRDEIRDEVTNQALEKDTYADKVASGPRSRTPRDPTMTLKPVGLSWNTLPPKSKIPPSRRPACDLYSKLTATCFPYKKLGRFSREHSQEKEKEDTGGLQSSHPPKKKSCRSHTQDKYLFLAAKQTICWKQLCMLIMLFSVLPFPALCLMATNGMVHCQVAPGKRHWSMFGLMLSLVVTASAAESTLPAVADASLSRRLSGSMMGFEAHMHAGPYWADYMDAFQWKVDAGTTYGYSPTPVVLSLTAGEHKFDMESIADGWYCASVTIKRAGGGGETVAGPFTMLSGSYATESFTVASTVSPTAAPTASPTNFGDTHTPTPAPTTSPTTGLIGVTATSWAEMKSYCEAGGYEVTLSEDFNAGYYPRSIKVTNCKTCLIKGTGHRQTLDMQGNGRFATVDAGGSLELHSLILVNGYAGDAGDDSYDGSGGIIATSPNCNLRMVNITCTQSDALHCGGALAAFNSNTELIACVFTRNSGNEVGGAIYIIGGVLIVSNSRFQWNKAGHNGGAVASRGGSLQIFTSDFGANVASGSLVATQHGSPEHGIIYEDSHAIEEARLLCTYSHLPCQKHSDCWCTTGKYEDCTHGEQCVPAGFGYGGAIAVSSATAVEISDCTLNNNKGAVGGAIYSTNTRVSVMRTNISSNSAVYGGAVAVYGSRFSTQESMISNNSASAHGNSFWTHVLPSYNALVLKNVSLGMGSCRVNDQHLIHLSPGSDVGSSYSSLVLDEIIWGECCMGYACANPVWADKGTYAIYRDSLSSKPPEGGGTYINPSNSSNSLTYCDSLSSYRWLHSAKVLVCTCLAGRWQVQVEQCIDIQCTDKKPLLCKVCPAGKFQPNADMDVCGPCAAGKYQPRPGSTSCLDCPLSNQYQNEPGSTSCKMCAACPAGARQGCGGSSEGYCTNCIPGRYANSSSGVCAECPAGRYQPGVDQGSCIACPVGKFQNQEGGPFCKQVAPGMHLLTSNGRVTEGKCPAGKFNDGHSDGECSPCPRGTVQPDEGRGQCVPCLTSQYVRLDADTKRHDNQTCVDPPLSGVEIQILNGGGFQLSYTGNVWHQPSVLNPNSSTQMYCI
jgi:hypothetical protein